MKKPKPTWLQIKDAGKNLRQIDRIGLKLANASHKWTNDERKAYERAVREAKKELA